MPSRRILKLASRIQFLITNAIQRELHDPRVGFVTILRVEPTEDLREAKVYFSVFGDEGVKSRTEHALHQATGFIQREVAQNLHTRVTPKLMFILDDTQDKISRVEKLIEDAVESDRKNKDQRSESPSESEEDSVD